MNAEDYPDKTVDELLEQDEDDPHSLSEEEEYEEMEQEYKELERSAFRTMQAAALGELFFEGRITLREYIAHVEWVEEQAREEGAHLL